HERGVKVLAEKHGFTESHAIALDVAVFGGGAAVAKGLEEANIITNKNLLPWDTSPVKPSGVRLGSQDLTRLGMKEPPMREVEARPRLRALVPPGPSALLEEGLDLAGRKGRIRLQVLFVHEADRRDVPRHGADGGDPGVDGPEGLLAGLVRHREDPFRTVVVGLLEEVAQGRGAHDVPEDRVDRHGARALRVLDGQGLLRDLRAQG